MICRHCGQQIDEDSRFCAFCGGNQEAEPVPPQAEADMQQPAEVRASDEAVQPEVLGEDVPIEMEELPSSEELVLEAGADASAELAIENGEMPFNVPASVPFAEAAEDQQEVFERRPVKLKKKGEFAADWLSLIIAGAIFIGLVVFGGASGYLFTVPHLEQLLVRFIPIALIAFGAVLTTRAKGPDLSIGAVMSLSSMLFVVAAAYSGSMALSLLVALLACAVVGIVNGVLAVLLRIPAVIATILVAALLSGVSAIFSWASTYALPTYMFAMDSIYIALIALGAALVVAFVVILLTKLGKPVFERDADDEKSPSFFGAYVLSALIAGTAGFIMMLWTGEAGEMVMGSKMIVVLLFFGILMSNKRADNCYFPVLYALLAAVVYTMLVDVFELYLWPNAGVWRLVEELSVSGLALAFVIIAYVTRRKAVKDMILRR